MVKIENKTGIPFDTKVIDTETGNEIKGVYGVEIKPFDCKTKGFIQVNLILTRCEIDITSRHEQKECEQLGKGRS